MRKIIASALVIGICGGISVAQAQKQTKQGEENKYLEYNYEKKSVKERKVIPYPPLREADVVYAKRVERIIDMREKKNQVMMWPKNPFNKLIYTLVTTGEPTETGKLKAYQNGDSLSRAMTVQQVGKVGGFCETVDVQNPANPNDPYDVIPTEVCTPFDYTQITRIQLNEEWIFDKQRGMFFPRIVSIAPLYIPQVGGQSFPEAPMFHIKYEDLRPILIREEVFNRQNDAQRLTYYDFFELRLFSSYITKESNDKDMAINQRPEFKDNPMEALYESERIKEEMFNWEHDLWEY